MRAPVNAGIGQRFKTRNVDSDTILILLKTRLDVAQLHETTLMIDCEKWDRELSLPKGSTAKFIDTAIQGTRFSIALRGNRRIKLVVSQTLRPQKRI
jgi:hypothetical protein